MINKHLIKSVCKAFHELTIDELYSILQLRSEIFVLEQNCLYQDMDGLDKRAYHLMLMDDQGILVGYARIFPPNITFREASIGRIISKMHGIGLGKLLMEKSIEETLTLFGQVDIRIGAQVYAIPFYERFGFESMGTVYIEDEIPHIEMLRTQDRDSHYFNT